MDFSAINAGMVQNITSIQSALTSVQVSAETFQAPAANVVKNLKEMETSVAPHLGQNIDMKL